MSKRVLDESPEKYQLYETSSQYTRWYFTAEELQKIRKHTNQKSLKHYQKNMLKEKEARIAKNTESINKGGSEIYEVDKIDAYLSPEEEEGLLMHYLNSLTSLFKKFDYSTEVKATAMIYIKRYFLFNSLMKHKHFNILVACVFLAAKTENQFTMADKFLERCKLPLKKADLIKMEFKVAAGINFDFTVLHPFLPLLGIHFELQELESNLALLQALYDKAIALTVKTYRTDLPFTHMPSQIALAIMKYLTTDTPVNFDQYLKLTFNDKFEEINGILQGIIDAYLKDLNKNRYETEQIRNFEKVLIFAKHPEKNKENALFKEPTNKQSVNSKQATPKS